MNYCIIDMPSVTYAQKAKVFIKSKGYECDVIRSVNSCGYSIKAAGDRNAIMRLLDEKGIPYKKNNGSGASSW